MTFFITDYIPGLRTYEDWARHEESVKPIRGRTYKPIARRRDWPMHMTRGEDGSISLHDGTNAAYAPCVTYNPDGTMVISNCGPWASAFRFVEATTGLSFMSIKGAPWLTLPGQAPVRVGIDRNRNHTNMVPLHFRREDGGWKIMTELETPQYYKLNVRALNALRKRIGPYMQQLEVFAKLRAETVYDRQYHYDHRTRTSHHTLTNPQLAVMRSVVEGLINQIDQGSRTPAPLYMATDDLDQWVTLNVLLMASTPERYRTTGDSAIYPVVCVSDLMIYAMEAAKREWRDELFTLAPVTKPSHRRNENAKYFV